MVLQNDPDRVVVDSQTGETVDADMALLRAAGWSIGSDGFWTHPRVSDGASVTENIAFYIEEKNVTIRSLRYRVDELRKAIEGNGDVIDK